jgi:ketosteroid isomerase-like protein
MSQQEFAAISRPPAGTAAPQIDSASVIKEIQISGEWAFMWTELAVTMTPPDGSTPVQRAGHTLTVLQRVNDKWLLAQNANLLTLVKA